MVETRQSHPLAWLAGLVLVVLGAFGYSHLEGADPGGKGDASPALSEPASDPWTEAERPSQLLVEGPAGPTDLVPTLRRIERGERHEHRNDGSVFSNFERLLPEQRRGYYREYVHPTPGVRGPGAQRLVLGQGLEVWYTPDHYESFERIGWALRMESDR